jgi:hypothetical protein
MIVTVVTVQAAWTPWRGSGTAFDCASLTIRAGPGPCSTTPRSPGCSIHSPQPGPAAAAAIAPRSTTRRGLARPPAALRTARTARRSGTASSESGRAHLCRAVRRALHLRVLCVLGRYDQGRVMILFRNNNSTLLFAHVILPGQQYSCATGKVV